MLWSEIRKSYPDQWVVMEALKAHTTPDQYRKFDKISVIETCPDGNAAMNCYRHWHRQYPDREFYFTPAEKNWIPGSANGWE